MRQNRRKFLKQSMKGITFCFAATQCPRLLCGDSQEMTNCDINGYIKKISEDLTYCAYRCSEKCEWLMASLQDDQEKMKEKAEQWSKKHGDKKIPVDQNFCYGCKPVDKPLGYIVNHCTVRQCAMEKKFGTCIECSDLSTCDKELWINYPTHREYVLKLQKEKNGQ